MDIAGHHLLLNPADPYQMDEYVCKQAEMVGMDVAEYYIEKGLDPSDPYQMFTFVVRQERLRQDVSPAASPTMNQQPKHMKRMRRQVSN